MKTIDQVMKELQEPFSEDELEFRVGATNEDKTKGLALAYIQARAIQNRLDKVLGINNWQVSYREITGGFIAKLELRIGEEWIAREDGANNTDFEPIKGGISCAFKRVASVWGIGRYLYEVENRWYPIKKQGRSYVFSVNPTIEVKEQTENIPQRKTQNTTERKPEKEAVQDKMQRARGIMLTFGKYSGKMLGEIYDSNRAYFKYLVENCKDESLVNACKYLQIHDK